MATRGLFNYKERKNEATTADKKSRCGVRYYLDFEFEDVTLTPISLGMVSQDGRTLYFVNVKYDRVITASKNQAWLTANVAPHLFPDGVATNIYHTELWADAIRDFLFGDSHPEFWGYYCDYDWVIFCRLFGAYHDTPGRMLDLPEHFPKYCLDLKQLANSVGEAKLKERVPIKNEHNALADAQWIKLVHEMIIVQHGRVV